MQDVVLRIGVMVNGGAMTGIRNSPDFSPGSKNAVAWTECCAYQGVREKDDLCKLFVEGEHRRRGWRYPEDAGERAGCNFLLAASFFGTHCLILMFECPLRRASRRFDIDRLRFLLVTSHHSERRREHFKKCSTLSIMRIGVAIPSVRRSRS